LTYIYSSSFTELYKLIMIVLLFIVLWWDSKKILQFVRFEVKVVNGELVELRILVSEVSIWQFCIFLLLSKEISRDLWHMIDMQVACFNIMLCMDSCCRSSRCYFLTTREISLPIITNRNKMFWWCHLFNILNAIENQPLSISCIVS
jgi:hypothetical protein